MDEATPLIDRDFFARYRPLVRDTRLPPGLVERYRPGMMIREPSFVDATCKFGGFAAPDRYLIFAGRFPCIDEVSEHPEWGLCVGQLGTFFKVLSVLRHDSHAQVTLMEVPEELVPAFAGESMGQFEQAFAELAATGFHDALSLPPRPEHSSRLWLDRLANPVGLREDGTPFDLDNPWTERMLAELRAAGLVP